MGQPRRPLALGRFGALLDLAMAAALGLFLVFATSSPGDAVPRPLVLAALFATPGVVGLIGDSIRQPWLLVAAAVALIPLSLISFAGVTLPFLVPAALFLAGAATMGPAAERWNSASAIGAAVAVAALLIFAGWAVLFGFTEAGCVPIPNGEACSQAFISVRGVIVALTCLIAAILVAVRLGVRRRQPLV